MNPELPKDMVVQSGAARTRWPQAPRGDTGMCFPRRTIWTRMKPAADTVFMADPIPADTKLTPEQQKLVLGGECACGASRSITDGRLARVAANGR